MKKTIIYINAIGRISGAERSLLSLIDALDRELWEPVVIAPEGELLNEVARRGLTIEPVPLRQITRPRSFRSWIRYLRVLWEGQQSISSIVRRVKPDIVHANTTSAMIFAAHLSNYKIIWQVRDLVPLGRIGKTLYRRATRVAAISDTVREDLLQCADDGGRKIILISPAVDTERFKPLGNKEEVRAELGLPAGMPLIGLIAQFVPWKCHHLFLDALELMLDRDWHGVLAGANLSGNSEYLDTIKERLGKPPLSERVTLLPWQPDSSRLMGTVDICALTSKNEPFGRALIEAMACGVPTVAVAEGGPTEIILPRNTGLLTEANARSLALELSRLIDDRDLRHRLGEAGRKRAIEEYSLEKQRRILSEIYGSI